MSCVSWIGLNLDAIRLDETAASCFGLDIARWKITAFVLGNFVIGLAGALFGMVGGFVAPNNYTFADSLIMASQTIGEPDAKARSASDPIESTPLVRTFHQILLWPLQLLPLKEGSQIHHHWEFLEKDAGLVWKVVDDEFCADPDTFRERHYREFVTFLPYVQRLLYGEGAKRRSMYAGQAVRSRLEPELFKRWFQIAMILLGLYLAGNTLLKLHG